MRDGEHACLLCFFGPVYTCGTRPFLFHVLFFFFLILLTGIQLALRHVPRQSGSKVVPLPARRGALGDSGAVQKASERLNLEGLSDTRFDAFLGETMKPPGNKRNFSDVPLAFLPSAHHGHLQHS